MIPPQNPTYIGRGGTQSWAPPYSIQGVRFYSFVLEADYSALQVYLDRVLNKPTGGGVTYRPLVDRVALGLMGAEKVVVGPLDDPKFYIPERDLAFWIPVARVERRLGVEIITKIAFYLSYVMVDDAWAVTSGRENYGYPKELARFVEETTEGAGPAAKGFLTHLEAHTLAVTKYGADTLAQFEKVVEIRRASDAPENPVVRALGGLEEVAKEFYGVLAAGSHLCIPGLGVAEELLELIVHHQYPLVFLKEFRDLADGRLACYQAVVESPVHITAFRAAGRLDGKYEIAIGDYESHPIVAELGLKGPNPPVLAAGYIDFDFIVDKGEDVRPS